jgi:hypothetical protein
MATRPQYSREVIGLSTGECPLWIIEFAEAMDLVASVQ